MVLEEINREGFGSGIPARDDFGLPLRQKSSRNNPSGDPYVDKMKKKVSSECAPEVFVEMTTNPVNTGATQEVAKDQDIAATGAKDLSNDPNKATDLGSSSEVSNDPVVISKPPVQKVVVNASSPETEINEDKGKVTTEGAIEEEWKEVKRKNSARIASQSHIPGAGDTSHIAVPAAAASSMPIYSALSRTITKSQRKKARRSGGKTPPHKH
ncbi:hypothetical protein ACET3Z_021334 [Daucus carota]